MEKVLLLNKKKLFIHLVCFVFISFFTSCKKEVEFSYDANSLLIDPIEKIIKIKKIKEIEIFKTDSLGKLDSTSLRKYYINSDGLVEKFEDKPTFAITLKIKYDGNLPSYLYCLSDYALEYTSEIKIDSLNKKIKTFWKDEFKNIEDSTIYSFNEKNQLIKVNNNIDLFNHFIRKKMGHGVFKVDFDEDLYYQADSLLHEKKITYISSNKGEYSNIFPISATVNYVYDNNKNLIKVVENYKFLNESDNLNKEISFKDGLPSEYLLNGKIKFIYKYQFY